MKILIKSIFASVFVCSFMVNAAVQWKAFNSLPAAVNFCANNHCLSIENIFGNEFPIKRYIVVSDKTNTDPGCIPEVKDGEFTCRQPSAENEIVRYDPPMYDPND